MDQLVKVLKINLFLSASAEYNTFFTVPGENVEGFF